MRGSWSKNAYTLTAHETRDQIEQAVSNLCELLDVEYVPAFREAKERGQVLNFDLQKKYVPALVCVSEAYRKLEQYPKMRNVLKRVAKTEFVADMAEDFERAWLMLADHYIRVAEKDGTYAAQRLPLAEELCNRCLEHNKSCAKALELLARIERSKE